MKSRLLVWLGMLACVLVPMAHAVEIMHWERLPLAVPLLMRLLCNQYYSNPWRLVS